MSDKLIGRIANSSDSDGGHTQFSQPWTAQAIKGKMEPSAPSSQVPSEFGNLQLVDNSHQLLKGYASSEQAQKVQYESAYSQPQKLVQHSEQLNGNTIENHIHTHSPKIEYLTGQTTIPASKTNDGYKPSENFSAKMPASVYLEGAQFNQVLDVPAVKGKNNYYNGLAQAHYEHGHLLGVPAHMVNGKMTSHLDHEIDLQLHKTK